MGRAIALRDDFEAARAFGMDGADGLPVGLIELHRTLSNPDIGPLRQRDRDKIGAPRGGDAEKTMVAVPGSASGND